MNVPVISVIVCTYNRANLLDSCLASLREQHLDSGLYEIIVVDNNSKDNTFDIAAAHMNKNGNMRYVTEENQGLSYARNKGCDEANGRYLAYIDDDATVPPEYLSNVLEVIDKYEPDIFGGPVYPYYTEEKPRWFRDKYATRKWEEKSGFSKTCKITGANYVIKKSILKELGMFDVELGMKGDGIGLGEDAKVLDTYRFKTPEADQKVYYALECYVRHHVSQYRMRVSYIMRRSYHGGRQFVKLRAKMGKKMTLGVVVRITIRNFYRAARNLVHEMLVHGPTHADYILACQRFFRCMGIMIEGLNQVRKEKST